MNDHLHFIINPKSGSNRGLQIFQEYKPILDKSYPHHSVTVTRYAGHAYNVIKELNDDRIKGIIVIGGDGTIHEVINGIIINKKLKDIPIGIIPAGTGNSLAQHLDISSPIAAIRRIREKRIRGIDIFEVHTDEKVVYSFNVIAWGIPAAVNIRAENLRLFGGERYNVAAVIEIFKNKTEEVTIKIGDQLFEGQYSFIVACNTIYAGNKMMMAPQAKMNDGLMDILLVKKIKSIELMRLFSKVFKGKHLPHKQIFSCLSDSLSIKTEKPQPIIIDGEISGHTPCCIKKCDQKVKMYS